MKQENEAADVTKDISERLIEEKREAYIKDHPRPQFPSMGEQEKKFQAHWWDQTVRSETRKEALDRRIHELDEEAKREWNLFKRARAAIQLDVSRWSAYTYIMIAISALAAFGLGLFLKGLTK